MSPLRIKLDGDTSAIPVTPDSLTDPATLVVDDRVRTELAGNRLVVLGRVGGLVLSDASTTVKGIVELATDAETITGTDTARAVTPAGLKADTDAYAAAHYVPFAMSAGTFNIPSTSPDDFPTPVTIVFPVGRFTQPPIVTGNAGQPTVNLATYSATTSQVTVRAGNISARSSGATTGTWSAIQMESGSGAG